MEYTTAHFLNWITGSWLLKRDFTGDFFTCVITSSWMVIKRWRLQASQSQQNSQDGLNGGSPDLRSALSHCRVFSQQQMCATIHFISVWAHQSEYKHHGVNTQHLQQTSKQEVEDASCSSEQFVFTGLVLFFFRLQTEALKSGCICTVLIKKRCCVVTLVRRQEECKMFKYPHTFAPTPAPGTSLPDKICSLLHLSSSEIEIFFLQSPYM